jgi:hypothetical protein
MGTDTEFVPDGGTTSEPEKVVELRSRLEVGHPAGSATGAMLIEVTVIGTVMWLRTVYHR